MEKVGEKKKRFLNEGKNAFREACKVHTRITARTNAETSENTR